jgi:hypothetical protein
VNGNYAFVCNSEGDSLVVDDISDPTQPTNIFHGASGVFVGGAVAGNYLYVADANDGLVIFDITNPGNPIKVAQTNAGPGGLNGLVVSGSHAYVSNDGLRIYLLGTPVPPRLTISPGIANTMLVSWPAPTAVFVLQQNSDLRTSNWLMVTNKSTVVDNQNQVRIARQAGIQAFRLKFP